MSTTTRARTAIGCVLLLAALSLNGCVPGPLGDARPAWVDRSDALRDISTWSLNGRIALQLGDRGFNGTLTWQQTDQAMRVDFRGPLGAGAFRVSGDPDELVLETGDGEVYLLDDPEQVMESEFGWGIPLHAMRYWLIGIPHPDFAASKTSAPDGRTLSITQLEWNVDYQRYSVFDDWSNPEWEMPRKLVLQKNDDIRIKLVISRWSMDSAE